MDTHLSIPFNLHFVDSPRFIGKPSDQVVFFYLWDMYIDQLYTKTSPRLLFSLSELSEQRNINRRAIKESLNHLVNIGLIVEDNGKYAMCADRYIELSRVFSTLSDKKLINDFIHALNTDNFEVLKKLGYNINHSSTSSVKEIYNCAKTHRCYVDLHSNCAICTENEQIAQDTNMLNDVKIQSAQSSDAILNDNGLDDNDEMEETETLIRFDHNASYKVEPYAASKIKKNLSFIPEETVKQIVDYLPDAVERFDYLFIWNLYQIIKENYGEREVSNDDNEGYHIESVSVKKVEIPSERYARDYVIAAYEDTLNMIEAGGVMFNGEKIPIGFNDYPKPNDDGCIPNEIFCVVDFKRINPNDNEEYLVISQDQLRDIYSQVEEAPKRRRRGGNEATRERDDKFFSQILRMEKEGAGDKLTDIEYAVATFLEDHYQISDNYEIVDMNETYQGEGCNFMNRNQLLSWLMDVTNVSREDFLAVLVNGKANDYGSIEMRPRMFSVDKIINWNRIHNQLSVVTEGL